ncbi:hypothetical protein [Moraxella ovis]|uniref:hypothetical protein n=1 Tax=Moraxella ovis TaxID=29433 RepID=UPI00283AA8B0|nr:hypothetical protein [Moraxella ovis]
MTLCLIGLKSGLFGSTSKDAVGRVITVPLIPNDGAIRPIAHLVDTPPTLPRASILPIRATSVL